MGGKKSSSSTTAPWAGQQPHLIEGMEQGRQQFRDGPIYYSGGDLVADRTQNYNQADERMVGYANQFMQPGGVYQTTEKARQSALNAPDVANNPYVQEQIAQSAGAMERDFFRNSIPGIEDAAGMVGQYGSSRHGVAEGLAAGELQSNIGQMAAQTQLGAYGQGLTAQANAMNQAGNMAQLGMLPMQIQRDVGLGQQAQQQAEMSANVERDMFNKNAGWTNVQNYLSSSGGQYGSMTTNKGGGGGAGGVVSGALGGAQIGNMIVPGGWGAAGGAAVGGLMSLFD